MIWRNWALSFPKIIIQFPKGKMDSPFGEHKTMFVLCSLENNPRVAGSRGSVLLRCVTIPESHCTEDFHRLFLQ
jgi:hypothetical protein